jgi:hypothetical protein
MNDYNNTPTRDAYCTISIKKPIMSRYIIPEGQKTSLTTFFCPPKMVHLNGLRLLEMVGKIKTIL